MSDECGRTWKEAWQTEERTTKERRKERKTGNFTPAVIFSSPFFHCFVYLFILMSSCFPTERNCFFFSILCGQNSCQNDYASYDQIHLTSVFTIGWPPAPFKIFILNFAVFVFVVSFLFRNKQKQHEAANDNGSCLLCGLLTFLTLLLGF